MLLLALDTATPAVTVALHDGRAVLAERTVVDPRRHAELLAPGIRAVLATAGADRTDLTTVAVGVGPGPFTSLRVGVVTARVLGLTLGVDVIGLCSLDALAERAAPLLGSDFLVATDARRREVYWARYGRVAPSEPGAPARVTRTTGPAVNAPAAVPRHGELPVVGRGAQLYPEALGRIAAPDAGLDVSAAALACRAVRGLDGAADVELLPALPLYLRRPDATEPTTRKRVLAAPDRTVR